jgi:hypothetical protein
MVMEIHSIANAFQAKAAYDRSSAQPNKIDPGKAKEAKKESVELSSSSVIMQKVKEKAMSAPEIRIPMVEKIMERIKNNDYPISKHLDSAIERMLSGRILT